jgi:hypothetical protein
VIKASRLGETNLIAALNARPEAFAATALNVATTCADEINEKLPIERSTPPHPALYLGGSKAIKLICFKGARATKEPPKTPERSAVFICPAGVVFDMNRLDKSDVIPAFAEVIKQTRLTPKSAFRG